jgi:hypothetical protein
MATYHGDLVSSSPATGGADSGESLASEQLERPHR